MSKKNRISLIAIMLLVFQVTFSQVNDNLVKLDEVVLTLPFDQTLGKSVLKVDKLNFNDINPIIKQYISNSISKLPGVSIISTGSGIGKPSIRGLSFNRVVVLSQGMRLENQQWGEEHGLALSSSGVNSVEVVKGPLYVLYGSDAMGGVLYIEPEKYLTSEDLEIDYTGIYNSNYSGLSNNLGLKGSSENFSYMLRADITDNGNYSSPDGEIENSWFKQNDFKAGVAYQTEKFQSDLRFSMSETEVGIPHMEEGHDDHDDHDDHEEDGHDDHDDHGEEDHYQEINHTTLTWKNTFDMGNDHTLDITLGRQLNERKEFGGHEEEGHDDHEGHEEEGHDDHDDHEGHEEGEAELDMELETTSIDIKLTMPQSDDLNLIIGTSLLNQENKNFGHETLIPDAEKKDFGLFALGQFDIDDTSQALIGVRYDNRSISSESSSNDYSNFNGSLGFKKDFGNSTLRINLSSGFRPPDLIELYADGSHHGSFQYKKGNTNLVAEESLQTDLSYQINNDNSIVSFDLFYNDISDYIYLNPSSMFEDGLRVYDYMQQDSKLYGGEIHLNKNTSIDWLSYYTSIEYVFAESMDGEALPFISPLTLNQVFNIDFGNNYSVEIDFIAKAKQSRVSMFEEETDGYSVLNLSGNYKTEFMTNDLNLFWRISNVFDKEYYDHLSRLKTAGIEEMGRNISVGLKYNF
ncbi:MAG: TonB-dependent receptor [Cryomorphaceae bacterium]|nr:TonB-dependent receptor [Cryomorphaceae bacterium]